MLITSPSTGMFVESVMIVHNSHGNTLYFSEMLISASTVYKPSCFTNNVIMFVNFVPLLWGFWRSLCIPLLGTNWIRRKFMFGWNFLNISLCCSFSFSFFSFSTAAFCSCCRRYEWRIVCCWWLWWKRLSEVGQFSYHCFLSLVCTIHH